MKEERVSEMAQWLGVLATKPDDVGLILRTHRGEGENWFRQVAFADLNMHTMMHKKINAKNKWVKEEDNNKEELF